VQNLINIRQSAAELLLFVRKSKMAAVDILPLIFVQYYGTAVCKTSNLVHLPKFRANACKSKRVMSDK